MVEAAPGRTVGGVRSTRLTSVAALAIAGILLAACGDGDDDEGGSAAQATTTPTTAAPTVRTDLVGADGSPVGRVTFVETGGPPMGELHQQSAVQVNRPVPHDVLVVENTSRQVGARWQVRW